MKPEKKNKTKNAGHLYTRCAILWRLPGLMLHIVKEGPGIFFRAKAARNKAQRRWFGQGFDLDPDPNTAWYAIPPKKTHTHTHVDCVGQGKPDESQILASTARPITPSLYPKQSSDPQKRRLKATCAGYVFQHFKHSCAQPAQGTLCRSR